MVRFDLFGYFNDVGESAAEVAFKLSPIPRSLFIITYARYSVAFERNLDNILVKCWASD